jgi:hypothetical protein
MWQEIIVGICVLAAAVFLLRHWLGAGKKATACGGCSNCDKTANTSCTTNSNEKTSP